MKNELVSRFTEVLFPRGSILGDKFRHEDQKRVALMEALTPQPVLHALYHQPQRSQEFRAAHDFVSNLRDAFGDPLLTPSVREFIFDIRCANSAK